MSRETDVRARKISEVAADLGIPPATIRSWERRYRLHTGRSQGGHRRYTPEEVDFLAALRNEIAGGRPPHEAVELVRSRRRSMSGREGELVERFVRAAAEFDGVRIRRALEDAAMTLPLEVVIQEVLLPAMRAVGSSWEANIMTVAHEHLASREVLAWLSRMHQMAPPASRTASILLACGPDEAHTIALEAFSVVLARRGWPAVMLGAQTPRDCLAEAIEGSSARAVVIVAHQALSRRSAVEALRDLAKLGSAHAFYAGGAFTTASKRGNVAGTYLGENFVAAARTIESIIGGS